MPTYEYQCLKCKKKFDALQSMSAAPLKKCIHCSGKVERLISAGAGLIFKGTGFYITDYKRQKTENRGQKTEERGQKTEDGGQKAEGKTDAKKKIEPKKSSNSSPSSVE